MVKDSVCTFASSQVISSGKGITKLFGLDRRNIKRTIIQKILLNTNQDAFQLNYKIIRGLIVYLRV